MKAWRVCACVMFAFVMLLSFALNRTLSSLYALKRNGSQIDQVARQTEDWCAEKGHTDYWLSVNMHGDKVKRVKGDCWENAQGKPNL